MEDTMVTIRTDLSDPVGGTARPIANAHFEMSVRCAVEAPPGEDDEFRQAALDSATFDFWRDSDEDIYSLEDGEPV